MAEKTCQYVETDHVMPGWGCCQCALYNGAWRQFCKSCKHPVCVEMPAEKVAESTMMAAQAQGLAVPDQNA